MQLLRGEQAHEMLGFEPGALLAYRAPEEDECLAIELTALVSQFIELGGLADVFAANLVHGISLLSCHRNIPALPGVLLSQSSSHLRMRQ